MQFINLLTVLCLSDTLTGVNLRLTGGTNIDSVISPKTGKTREESTVYLWENLPKPSHFSVIPYEICWMTNRWFYQHGSFVVLAVEKLFENFHAETFPKFLPEFRVEMRRNFPEPINFSIHQRIDINIIGIFFSQLGPFVCPFMTLWHFEGNMREISVW